MMRAPIKANAAQIISALIGRVRPIHSLLWPSTAASLGDLMQQARRKCAALRQDCDKIDLAPDLSPGFPSIMPPLPMWEEMWRRVGERRSVGGGAWGPTPAGSRFDQTWGAILRGGRRASLEHG